MNNAVLLGLGVMVGGCSMLIYRGLIEDNRTPSVKFMDSRMENRFSLTSSETTWDARVNNYRDSCLRIPNIGDETNETEGNSKKCRFDTGTSTTDNGQSTTPKSVTITKEQLKVKCRSMMREEIRDGFREIHWLLFRHWCTDDIR